MVRGLVRDGEHDTSLGFWGDRSEGTGGFPVVAPTPLPAKLILGKTAPLVLPHEMLG